MTPPAAAVLAFWGLESNPFDIAGTVGGTIAITESMRKTSAFIVSQANLGGCSAVLGSIGDGKTTALKHAKKAMIKQPEKFVVVNPVTLATGSLTPNSLVRYIYEVHGSYIPRYATSASKLTALIDLVEHIPARTVLLLDECQMLHGAVIRLVKELADITSNVSTVLVGHRLPMENRLAKTDSTDLAQRLDVGRTFSPPPLSLDDARRLLDQRRSLASSLPEISADVLKEMLAHECYPLGLLRLAWNLLEYGAETGLKEVSAKTLRATVNGLN
jgi:type II secretory pathway predicted ATPase ExeA